MDAVMQKLEKEKSPCAKLEDFMVNGIKRFPKGFFMPRLPPFSGKGSPTAHVNQIVTVLPMAGLTLNQIACLFPMTLKGGTVNRYSALPFHIKADWKSLIDEFAEFYAYDVEKKTILADLKAVRQKPNKKFEKLLSEVAGYPE